MTAEEFKKLEIEVLPIGPSAVFYLSESGIKKIDDLIKLSIYELSCIRGVGKNTINAIIDRLNYFGLSLRDDNRCPLHQPYTNKEIFNNLQQRLDSIENKLNQLLGDKK